MRKEEGGLHEGLGSDPDPDPDPWKSFVSVSGLSKMMRIFLDPDPQHCIYVTSQHRGSDS